ncbi:hypothetical protein DAI22_06g181600 [Oryza sativa Japonica Group]|nr:hypothetical protein DAI22_06g181600 [Oryza sativa Japonica Group]
MQVRYRHGTYSKGSFNIKVTLHSLTNGLLKIQHLIVVRHTAHYLVRGAHFQLCKKMIRF